MRFVVTTFVLFIGTALCAEPGQTDLDDHWANQWYLDEPFHMYCNSSVLDVQSGDRIEWETPSGKVLKGSHDDSDFKLSNMHGVDSLKLEIKKVREDLKGVYICRIYNNTALRAKQLIGLNLQDYKHQDLSDKYHHNIIVAIIATAVFVVPLLTSCAVYEFRYQTPEEKEKNRQRRQPRHYVADEQEMKAPIDNGESVAVTDEKGAYENPNFDENLSTNL